MLLSSTVKHISPQWQSYTAFFFTNYVYAHTYIKLTISSLSYYYSMLAIHDSLIANIIDRKCLYIENLKERPLLTQVFTNANSNSSLYSESLVQLLYQPYRVGVFTIKHYSILHNQNILIKQSDKIIQKLK